MRRRRRGVRFRVVAYRGPRRSLTAAQGQLAASAAPATDSVRPPLVRGRFRGCGVTASGADNGAGVVVASSASFLRCVLAAEDALRQALALEARHRDPAPR